MGVSRHPPENSLPLCQETSTERMTQPLWIFKKIVELNNESVCLALDSNDNLYFTEAFNKVLFRVLKCDYVNNRNPNREKLATLRSWIILDGDDTLYNCDYVESRFWKYEISTNTMSVILQNHSKQNCDGDLKTASIKNPICVCKDNCGDFLITHENYVRKVSLRDGIVTTLAGSERFGYKDGEASQALFAVPTTLVVRKDGSIIILDQNNMCLRQLKDGWVSTLSARRNQEEELCIMEGPLFKVSLFPRDIALADDHTLLVACEQFPNFYQVDLETENVSPICFPETIVQLVVNKKGWAFAVTNTGIYLLQKNVWKWQRYLWIGHLKEDSSYCWLAAVPMEIITAISCCLPKLFLKNQRN